MTAFIGRRDFITLLGGTAAWPVATHAQQVAMSVIGFLAGPSAGGSRSTLAGFRQGLREAGYIEGQNVHIAFRWAEGRYDRFPEMAAELVSLPVAVIVAFGAPAAKAAIAATSLRHYQSFLAPPSTRSSSDWLPALIAQVVMPPAWLSLTANWLQNNLSCCAKCCPQRQ
jgi:ABC transporter substrate binding protein